MIREGEGPLFLFLTIKIPAEMKISIIFACLFKSCASKSDHRSDPWMADIIHVPI